MKLIISTICTATVREVWEVNLPDDFMIPLNTLRAKDELMEMVNSFGNEQWVGEEIVDKGPCSVESWRVVIDEPTG